MTFGSGALPGRAGQQVTVELDDGTVQHVSLSSLAKATGAAAIAPVLRAAARAGNSVWRGRSYTGTPNTLPGSRSDIWLYILRAYAPTFSQPAS